MKGLLQKHSLTLQGHRTSVSLEDIFWKALQNIAKQQNKTPALLVTEIDARRDQTTGLSSAIRVFVLDHYINKDKQH